MTCRALDNYLSILAWLPARRRVHWWARDANGDELLPTLASRLSPASLRHYQLLVVRPVGRWQVQVEYTHHPPLPAA